MGEIAIRNNSFIQSMHNDIQCLSLDNTTRPCDRCWFTSKQIQDWAGMNKDTLNRKLEKLARVGRIIGLKDDETVDNIIDIDITNDGNTDENSSGSNLSLMNYTTNSDIRCIKLPDERGTLHYSKIYNLNVLNHLAMVELDNEKLNTIANKFSDILSEVETTGSYNIQKSTPSYEIEDPIERAKVWIAEQEAKLALEAKNNELVTKNKALKADNENLTQVLTDTSERLNHAIRTKAQINDKRTASLMGKVSGQSRKITRLENDLTVANDNIKQLETQLDDTYSSLYRDKRVAEIIKGKYEFITYKFNTLKPRVNKALKAIALGIGEPIKEKPNPMNDTYAPILYFTKRVVDQLLDNIEKDHSYLKRFGK